MLNSRHIFIHQGSLTSNDNGRKKFNKSEMRYEDELLLKWVSRVNDVLFESAKRPDCIFIFAKSERDMLYRYTQLEHFSFEKEVQVENISEMREALEQIAVKNGTGIVVAGSREEVEVREKKGVEYFYLYDMPLWSIYKMGEGIPVPAEAKEKLRGRTLQKIKDVNEELETISGSDRVLIYGGGYQTEAFLRYANINRLNIVGVVDRRHAPIFNIAAKDTTFENIKDADVIIVTPYFAANEIKKYLASLNLGSRVICIADICGEVLFTGQENTWAPDLEQGEKYVSDGKEQEKLLAVTDEVNHRSPYFIMVKRNVPYCSNTRITGKLLEFEQDTALVIQGPIIRKQNFTLNTLKLYHKNFPELKLILSIWEEDWKEGEFESLSNLNVEVVRAKKPETRGYQNVNLQLETSYAGIKRAKNMGYRYAFKTRTDMRFYSPDLLQLMFTYMEKFPLKRKKQQKERLVIFPPRYDYYFFIPDFFMFGNVDDMLNYWDSGRSFSDTYVGESAETMLGIRYAEYIGERVPNSLDYISDYDRVIKEYFAIVEDKMLDYVWYKYFYNKLWECEYHYNSFNFVDWLAGQETKL